MIFDLNYIFFFHWITKVVDCSEIVIINIILLWWYHTDVVLPRHLTKIYVVFSFGFKWVWQHSIQRRAVVTRRVQDTWTSSVFILAALSFFAFDRASKGSRQVILIFQNCLLLYFVLLLFNLMQYLYLLMSHLILLYRSTTFALNAI